MQRDHSNSNDWKIFPFFKQQQLMHACRGGNAAKVERLLRDDQLGMLALQSKDRSGRTPLHWACESGKARVVQLLLDSWRSHTVKGHRITEIRDKNNATPLQIAAARGHTDVVEVLLENHANVESKELLTPLHYACIAGNLRVASLLIENGADVNARDTASRTALHYASMRSLEMVQLLLQNGADVHQRESGGEYTALHYACQEGKGGLEVVRALINNGADLYSRSVLGSTPLHCACSGSEGNLDIVHYLVLEKGADPEDVNLLGKTPLDIAIGKDHCSIAQFLLGYLEETPLLRASKTGDLEKMRLLSQGQSFASDVLATDKLGRTSLHWACLHGHVNIIEFLLCHKPENNANYLAQKDNKGWTPLGLAVSNGHRDVACLLLSHGAYPDGDPDGVVPTTPLHTACITSNDEIVSLLLENGANIEAKSESGKTPQQLAVHAGCLDVVCRLLINDANLHAKDEKDGYTPLHSACEFGYLEIARALTELGAEINEQNAKGSTPLHCACSGKDSKLDIVRFLVTEGGADLSVKNAKGQTPLAVAIASNNHDAARFLEDALHSQDKPPPAVTENNQVAEGKDFLVRDQTYCIPDIASFHMIQPAAERAWIAQQKAQANQKERSTKLQALGTLKQSKTTEIQQAIDMAKLVCPEVDLDHPLWVRVVMLQKESADVEKRIEKLLQSPRPVCPEVEQYLKDCENDDMKVEIESE